MAVRRKPEPEPELDLEEEETEVSEDEDEDGDEPDPEESEEEAEEEAEEESESEGDEESDEEEEEPKSSKPTKGRPRKEPAKPQLSKKDAAELFKKYEERKNIVGELAQHMEQAKAEVANVAFEIYEKLGVGPFRWKGKTLKVFKSKKNPNSARIRVISDQALEIG